MRRALGLAVALAVGLAGTVLAGAMYRNDSGAVARAVRIEFSEPAEITSMWPSFPQRDPQGPATVIVLSGGEVPAGGWFSFTWRPDAARVVKIEWFASPPSSARPNLGFSDPKAKPEVHGELLNPAFFAHPAYVMQGLSERDRIFALPLRGVPELAFYPVLGDLPASSLTWTFVLSYPEGIGAAIEDGTLYIWGSSAEWQGYGEVELHVSAPDGRSGYVAIPVTVFCTDRTLVNPLGKKDYFVPWGMILDINRVLSVEDHMRQYNKPDLGLLDRTLRFSRWRPMEYRKDVDLETFWDNELSSGGEWSQHSQFALVDVLFMDLLHLGFNGVRFSNQYFIANRTSPVILPIYHLSHLPGVTKQPDEEAYLVCEAHRLGLSVLAGNYVAVGNSQEWGEIFESCPTPRDVFYDNYMAINRSSLVRWTALGVDAVDTCVQLSTICYSRYSEAEARQISGAISRIAADARQHYPGPLYHDTGIGLDFFPGTPALQAPFWTEFDILGISAWGVDLTGSPTDELDLLVSGWRRVIRSIIEPFVARFDRPVLLKDASCFSVTGCANYGFMCAVTPFFDPRAFSRTATEDYFRAVHMAFREVEGFYGPGWARYTLSRYQGGIHSPSAEFRLKIDDVLQEMHLGRVSPRVVQIDGIYDDWRSEYLVGEDPKGDAAGPFDILRFWATHDPEYLYLRVDYAVLPDTPSILDIDLDVDGDGRPDLRLPLNNIWTPYNDWGGHQAIRLPHPPYTQLGIVDCINSGNSLECRTAKRFLQPFTAGPSLWVRLRHYDMSSQQLSDETRWYRVPF